MILRGAKLVATNLDPNCPVKDGLRPGCGAMVAMLETAAGVKAFSVGKPSPFMMRAARKDLAIGGLQCVKRDFQTHTQQSARQAEMIVGRGRKQMHVFRIAANQRQEIGIERVSIGAIGKFDATHQVFLGGKHIVDGPHRNARIDGRICEPTGVSGTPRIVGACVLGTRNA